MPKKKQNPLPKCIVCKKDTLSKLNDKEVQCTNCHSQYSLEYAIKTKGKRVKHV